MAKNFWKKCFMKKFNGAGYKKGEEPIKMKTFEIGGGANIPNGRCIESNNGKSQFSLLKYLIINSIKKFTV